MDIKPVVFAGLYPVNNADFEAFRVALEKLSLNDASLRYEPEVSPALGFGFRCGFLGMLHMEIIQERLEREYELELITTAPSVVYQVECTDGSVQMIHSPSELPDPARIKVIREPYILPTFFARRSMLVRLSHCVWKSVGIRGTFLTGGAR